MKICAGPGPEGSMPKPGRKSKLGPFLPSHTETLYSCPRDARKPWDLSADGRTASQDGWGRASRAGRDGQGRAEAPHDRDAAGPRREGTLPCERLGGQLYSASLGEGREGPNLNFRPGFGFEPSGPGPAQIFILQNFRWSAGFRFRALRARPGAKFRSSKFELGGAKS